MHFSQRGTPIPKGPCQLHLCRSEADTGLKEYVIVCHSMPPASHMFLDEMAGMVLVFFEFAVNILLSNLMLSVGFPDVEISETWIFRTVEL